VLRKKILKTNLLQLINLKDVSGKKTKPIC